MEGKIIEKVRFPSPSSKVNVYSITYISGGLKVKGLMAEPREEGKYDGFLYLRGGIKNVGQVRVARIVQFASEGFVVMAPFYRGNQGGEGNEDFAGDDRQDAFAAFELLRRYEKVREDRIHVFGFSRGGVMALLTAIEYEDVKSVVSWGGVSDMHLTYAERVDLRRMLKRVVGGTPNKVPERYDWRTPLLQAEKINCPVLLIHGAKDHNVSIEHSFRLEKTLKELNKKVESWYFYEFTHYFPPQQNRRTVQRLTQWMKEQ